MDENEIICEALDRLDKLSNEIEKMKNALISFQEGNDITETFNDEIFCEDAKERKQVTALLSRMIEHLLKIQFSSIDRYKELWISEVENKFRPQIQDILLWYNVPDKTLINSTINNLQSIYDSGIKLYKKDSEKYPDLRDNIAFIPVECPWTLEELMDSDIIDLCNQL